MPSLHIYYLTVFSPLFQVSVQTVNSCPVIWCLPRPHLNLYLWASTRLSGFHEEWATTSTRRSRPRLPTTIPISIRITNSCRRWHLRFGDNYREAIYLWPTIALSCNFGSQSPSDAYLCADPVTLKGGILLSIKAHRRLNIFAVCLNFPCNVLILN